MIWFAQCHLCGEKTRVPTQYQMMKDAKAWASLWEDTHIKEDHNEQTPGSESEAGS